MNFIGIFAVGFISIFLFGSVLTFLAEQSVLGNIYNIGIVAFIGGIFYLLIYYSGWGRRFLQL